MTNHDAQLSIRDLLFGDLSLGQIALLAGNAATGRSPWVHFAIAQQRQQQGDTFGAIVELEKVLDMERLESRVYLQVWHCLRQLGSFPPADAANEIKGVVFEVALQEGLDIVAAYADHTARYFNYSGATVVWDIADPEMDKLIDKLLSLGQEIIPHIDLWDEPRPPAPPAGSVRISLLTHGGMYLGEAPFEVIAQDALVSQTLHGAIDLMKALIERQKGHPS